MAMLVRGFQARLGVRVHTEGQKSKMLGQLRIYWLKEALANCSETQRYVERLAPEVGLEPNSTLLLALPYFHRGLPRDP
jgi:hypothetical protein